jgi:phage terminase small subunit
MAKGNELTPQQARFVEEYLLDLNATQACIRAGYSARCADTIGPRLYGNVRIRARIDEAMAQRSVRTGVSIDRVVRELARIGFASAPDFIDMEEATLNPDASADDKAAIASIKVKRTFSEDGSSVEREIKLWDKPKTLETLAKHLGMMNGPKDSVPGILAALVDAVGNVK